MPWSKDAIYSPPKDEFTFLDWLMRLILRISTGIDFSAVLRYNDEHAKTYWEGARYNYDKNQCMKYLNKYINYMKQYSTSIPLVCFQDVLLKDGKNHDGHVYITILDIKNKKAFNLNSNLNEPYALLNYYALQITYQYGSHYKTLVKLPLSF